MAPNEIITIILCIIVIVAAVIYRVIKIRNKIKEHKEEQARLEEIEQAEESYEDEADAPQESGGTALIFVNGGRPASGSRMGILSVDGKKINLSYDEAPIAITIPAGRHHVVVEGGVQGDARIDRVIDFGVAKVWTVDMPGGDDEDLIRHQMIGYYEYSEAIRNCGFTVTKKTL